MAETRTAGAACITGATSGIGAAYAIRLATEGYRLILTGRREEKLREVANRATPLIARARQLRPPDAAEGLGESAGGDEPLVRIVVGDLADPAASRELTDLIETTSDLDVLIHNAGYGHGTGFFDTPVDQLHEMGEVHVQCAAALVRSAGAGLIRDGQGATGHGGRSAAGRGGQSAGEGDGRRPARFVVLVASLATSFPTPQAAMYTSTKAYLVELARAIHPHFAKAGVRVQALCPGFTHTEFHDRLNWNADRRRNRGPIRWMTAEDVVDRSLRALRRRGVWADPKYVPGFWNRFLALFAAILPHRLMARIVTSRFGASAI